ncbi:hypothetical protein SAMN05192535_3254 [Shouchella rhizosphaerae]|nr:hypothetical protein SAMN05192535_3254 [Shouchella rhizosphaerae]
MDITVSIMKKCLLPQGMIVQSSHAFKFVSNTAYGYKVSFI